MASAAVEKRQYLVRLLFMGLARNSLAGALIERHELSQSRYSYLNSFNVIARSVAGSRTPRCASSMIFGQRDVLRQTALRWGPNTSVASRTHWISLGDLRHRRRNDRGCAGVSFMRAFRPPCQRTGAPLGIANGRDAGTCRGGAPLGGLLCALWSKRGSAWLIVFSGQFLNPTLVRCTQRFEQSLGGCLRVAALQGLVAIRLLDPLARQAARSMTALNPVGGSLRAER
jgi:hypothetical protein